MTEQNGSAKISANALEWAADVLRARFDEVFSLRENALESADIEGVHKMRVAIRRLRSALRDFAPLLKKRPFAKPKNELKRLAAALGTARDEDVAIAALEKLRKKARSAKLAKEVAGKIKKRRAARAEAQEILEKTLEPDALENLREDFFEALRTVREKGGKAAEMSAREAGSEAILKSLGEFCELGESLYEPFNCKDLHELRIAAKRLRYAIELFTDCFGEELAPFAEEITEMQNFLGELHDRDLWIENFSRRLHKTHDKTRRADFWLLSRFVKERTKNYRAALKLWDKWQKNDFVERLRKFLKNEELV